MRSPSDSFLPGRLAGLLLVVLVVTLWCANLQHRVLQHPDEGRYAEIAREMTVTGNWLTPRLNGLKYFEKPPLQYWLTAAAFETFGVHEWTARLWTALSGLLGVAAIAWAGWRIGGTALGVAAGLALAGTLWQVALSQILTLDALLSLLLATAFAAFVVAQRDDATGAGWRNAMWMTWAALRRRHAREGAHRHPHSRRGARALHAADARLGTMATTASCERRGALPADRGAVVRGGVARQP